jgi:hypothetical protein
MMDWNDWHCRFFHRLLTCHSRLYTEMVTGLLLHGDVPRHLRFNAEEHPLALQLGGSELCRRPTPSCARWWCRKSPSRPRRPHRPPSARRPARTTAQCG